GPNRQNACETLHPETNRGSTPAINKCNSKHVGMRSIAVPRLYCALMPLTSGTKIGPYEIQAPLGAGGMGEVYRAQDTRLDRAVAVKVLPSSFASDPDRLRRFEQEARSVAALNHPNILSVHDMGTHEGTPY